jgi:hypothetical protein
MARFRFTEDQEVIGRLDAVIQRPLENSRASGVDLLRLEFRIHTLDRARHTLHPTTMIVCQEVVVGAAIDPTTDSSLMTYANALGVRHAQNAKDWLAQEAKDRWVKIVFGPRREPDHRNPFKRIERFDASNFARSGSVRSSVQGWVTVKQAARALGVSEATVRRIADRLADSGHDDLLRHTRGGHRRIRLSLLQVLYDQDG